VSAPSNVRSIFGKGKSAEPSIGRKENARWQAGAMEKRAVMNSIVPPINTSCEPTIKVVTVTPDLARQWLGRNTGNRPLSSGVVNRYTNEMTNGRWRMTGDAIRFSNTGKLIDGQHRLTAVVRSGVSITSVVIFELEDSIFGLIDDGKPRGRSDVLYIEFGLPVETTKLLSSSALLVHNYENEIYSFKGKISNNEIVEFVRQRPGLIHAAQYVYDNTPRESPVARSIAVAFFHFASELDRGRAERFIERFMVGAVDGVDDNLLHLRNAAFSARSSRRPFGTREMLGRLVKIWNSERRGKPIRYFNNTSLRQDEAFPRFI
jgi:hypothetical protein